MFFMKRRQAHPDSPSKKKEKLVGPCKQGRRWKAAFSFLTHSVVVRKHVKKNPAVRYWFLKNIPGGLEIVCL